MASLNLAGKTAGYVKITAPDDSSNNPTVVLPTESGELALKGEKPLNLSAYRNLIINGDMRIAQRGTSVSDITSDGFKTVDRMYNNIAGGSAGTWTITQDTDVPTGQGFSNSLKYQCTTAETSLTGVVQLYQKIEGQMLQHLKYGTSSAETTTFSFWVKSNKTGTYICEIYQADSNRSISKSFTIDSANTWEKKIITVEGDTSGTINNDNGEGYRVTIWLAAASIYTSGTLQTSWGTLTSANRAVGVVNLADSTSNYINITGVQLEVGDTATPFEHRPYDMELARCQRYFQRLPENAEYLTAFYFDGTSRYCTTVHFPVVMRTSSYTIVYGTAEYRNGSTYTNGTYLNNARRDNLITIRITCPSAPNSGGYALGLKLIGTWTLDAEL